MPLAAELAARILAARLRAGTGATVYRRGSSELVAVSSRTGPAGDLAMGLLSARRRALEARLGGAVTVALYTPAELEDACRHTVLTFGLHQRVADPRAAATHLAPRAPIDELDLRLRPCLQPPAESWRRLAGPHLRLPRKQPERLTVEWLELQYRWRRAFRATADRDALASLERSTARVAELLRARARDAGYQDVVLLDGNGAARPLVDWRARCDPGPPDERFELRPGSVSDPAALAAASKASHRTQAALRSGDLIVMPGTATHTLRGVSCPVTDPVSHSLAVDGDRARFPALAGWSAADCAGRALAEHRAWLTRRPLMGGFGPRALELMLTAARAAVFHESVTEEAPVLPLTTAAVVEALADRHPESGGPAAAGLEALATSREDGRTPQREVVDEFERALRSLPCYSDLTRSSHGPRAGAAARARPDR